MAVQSIPDILAQHAIERPDAIAILGLEGEPLTYKRLYEHMLTTVESLHTFGVKRNQRVGMIIPQGPELVTALLSVASCATAVPFNPALQADEYRAYLQSARVERVIIQSGFQPEARAVAKDSGIPIIELTISKGSACGLFTLKGLRAASTGQPEFAQPEDIATLVLSSGTTSRPKIIPKGQVNLVGAGLTRNRPFDFTSQDRVLNVLSMWFAGGQHEVTRIIINGGSAFCAPGFDALHFFEWLDIFRPTLFSGTTTLFQALLPHAATHQAILQRHRLRFLQTGTMAMPDELRTKVESVFNVPLIQLYGLSETGVIANDPLPPSVRKPDSVGLVDEEAEVAIFDMDGRQLGVSQTGEIWVRGPYVFQGYENDPMLTTAAFVNGWFKTGDQGYLDEDGYLFVTGRIKEIIICGGEKISPIELEAMLMTHPDAAEVAAFGVPDPHMGEEVGVAFVRKPGSAVSAPAIRQFISTHLAASKIPRHILFLDSLPRTSIGKVKRLALAQLIQIPRQDSTFTGPRTDIEQRLVEQWAELLHCPAESISVHSHFRDLGGDSLAAARLVFQVRETFNVMVTIIDFFDTSTIAQQSHVLENLLANPSIQRKPSTLIPIRTEGTRPPLYCLHAVDGGVYFYKQFVSLLRADQPIYGLQAVGMDGIEAPLDSMESIVSRQAQEIRSVQLRGPYFLCGYSAGGRLALETARILHDTYGESVYVFIADDQLGVNAAEQSRQQRIMQSSLIPRFRLRLESPAYVVGHLPWHYKVRYITEKVRSLLSDRQVLLARKMAQQHEFERLEALMPPTLLKIKQATNRALKTYEPRPYMGPLTYLRARDDAVNIPFFRTWNKINQGAGEMFDIPGTHFTIMNPPFVNIVSEHLQRWLDRFQQITTS